MITLDNLLRLSRCPHCGIDNPNLAASNNWVTLDSEGRNERRWRTYNCAACGGVVTAWGLEAGGRVLDHFPSSSGVSDDIDDDDSKRFFTQAKSIVDLAPSASIMAAARAMDAMLIDKDYKEGELVSKIERAAEDHLITGAMAEWATLVRWDANAQRHPEETVREPTADDAANTVAVIEAFAEYLYVIPARVDQSLERLGRTLEIPEVT
jgi:hypothetical protein